MALGEPVQGLAGEILLRHLALELDWVAAVLAHGLSPRKPGPDSPILKTSPVHPQGCTPTDWYKQNVYDPSNSKIGDVKDVL